MWQIGVHNFGLDAHMQLLEGVLRGLFNFELQGGKGPFSVLVDMPGLSVATTGQMDLPGETVKTQFQIYLTDFASLAEWVPAISQAGGRFSGVHGEADFDGGSTVSTNGLLHDAVLEHFR